MKVAPKLRFGGPPECEDRPFCLGDAEQDVYGLDFKTVKKLDTGGPQTRKALTSGAIDVALLFTGSSVIPRDAVLLRDNKGLQPSENPVFILRREAGEFAPEFLTTMQTFAAQSVLAIQNARLFVEIQRQKQYSDVLVESIPVAIATMDLQGMVVGWNPAAERLFGYSSADAVGRSMEELVATPEIRDDVRGNVERTLAGEWIRDITRRVRNDGALIDVEISSVPVIVEGARVGMIAIYHDITELLLARREDRAVQ